MKKFDIYVLPLLRFIKFQEFLNSSVSNFTTSSVATSFYTIKNVLKKNQAFQNKAMRLNRSLTKPFIQKLVFLFGTFFFRTKQ